MDTITISGELTGLAASRILGVVKRVEVVMKDSEGNRQRFKLNKKEAYPFLRENPDYTCRLNGNLLEVIT